MTKAFRSFSTLGLAAIAGLMFLSSSVSAANVQALSFSVNNQAGNQFYAGGLGNDFNVLSSISVDSLGVFDSGGDGIAGSILVGIYDLSDVASGPLVSTSISGSGDPLVGSFRLSSVTPLILDPGSYSVVAFDFSENGNINNVISSVPLTQDDNGGLISFVDSRYGSGAFPTMTTVGNQACSGNPEACFGAGTFTFSPSPVPLPAAAWLFISGLGAFGFLGRRKARA